MLTEEQIVQYLIDETKTGNITWDSSSETDDIDRWRKYGSFYTSVRGQYISLDMTSRSIRASFDPDPSMESFVASEYLVLVAPNVPVLIELVFERWAEEALRKQTIQRSFLEQVMRNKVALLNEALFPNPADSHA